MFQGQSLKDLTEPVLATRYLAKFLLKGELTLLLGAGVSMANSLPSWKGLVRHCEAAVDPDSTAADEASDTRTSAELQQAMEAVYEQVGDDDKFRDLVRGGLYAGTDVLGGAYSDDVLQSMLLIAIGALVTPSQRGSIREVITLNFDDLLEWYLHLHGYRTQSVAAFPVYLRSDVDVTIFHPHGFLPLSAGHESTQWLVFRHSDYLGRLAGTVGGAWARHLTSVFATKRLLAVGTSMGDIDIAVHLTTARADHSDESLPAGFVVGPQIVEAKQRQLLHAGLVPVSLPDVGAVPGFLLDVCRVAAQPDSKGQVIV